MTEYMKFEIAGERLLICPSCSAVIRNTETDRANHTDWHRLLTPAANGE